MSRHSLKYVAALVCGILALAVRPAPAGDGKADDETPALSGTWEKKAEELKPLLTFDDEDDLTIYPHGDDLEIQIECSYAVAKDGLVKAKVTRIAGRQDVVDKVKELLPVGKEFRFKWTVKGDTAKLDDLEGEEVEHLKGHMEGKYAKET